MGTPPRSTAPIYESNGSGLFGQATSTGYPALASDDPFAPTFGPTPSMLRTPLTTTPKIDGPLSVPSQVTMPATGPLVPKPAANSMPGNPLMAAAPLPSNGGSSLFGDSTK